VSNDQKGDNLLQQFQKLLVPCGELPKLTLCAAECFSKIKKKNVADIINFSQFSKVFELWQTNLQKAKSKYSIFENV
jgi:hypothetical protein